MRHHHIRQPMRRHGRALWQVEWALLTLPFTWPLHVERALVNRRRRAHKAHQKARRARHATKPRSASQAPVTTRSHTQDTAPRPLSIGRVLLNAWQHGYRLGEEAGRARLVARYPELLDERPARDAPLDARVRRWLYLHGLPGGRVASPPGAPQPLRASTPVATEPSASTPESMLSGPKTYKRPEESARETHAAYVTPPEASEEEAEARKAEPPAWFADLPDTLVALGMARTHKQAVELLSQLPAGIFTRDMTITDAIRAVRAHVPRL